MPGKSVFAPPRNKPKLSLQPPTLAVGVPMVMPQVIDRPVNLVDDEGNWHGRMGENGQEQVSVKPSGLPTNDPAGGPNYASGGGLLIGTPPGDPASSNPYTATMGQGIFSGNWGIPQQQPVYGPPSPQQISPPTGWGQQQSYPQIQPPTGMQSYDPSLSANPNNPNAQILALQQRQLAAKRALLNSGRNVLDIRAQNMPLRSAVNSAKFAVNSASSNVNQLQRGVIQQGQQNDQARLGELTGIYAASKNVPDLMNVANAKQLYKAQDRRSAQMGVSAEEDVNLPPEWNGPAVAGTRPKIMSQEERLSEKAGYEAPIRNQQLELAKSVVDLAQTDVTAARLQAERAGLTLDQANEMVNQAELAVDYGRLFEDETSLDLADAQQAPFPGAVRYTDPATGEGSWITPQERDQRQTQYQENVQQPYQQQLQGQGSQYAGLTIPQLLNTIPKLQGNNNPLYTEPVLAELIRRFKQQGYSDEQANQAARALLQQELASRSSGGGMSEITSAPAAAPSSPVALPPGSPTLPPGYIP